MHTRTLSLTGAAGTLALSAVLTLSVMASPRHPDGTVGPAGWGVVTYGATVPVEPSTGVTDPVTDPLPVAPAVRGDWQAAGEWSGWLAGQSPAFAGGAR